MKLADRVSRTDVSGIRKVFDLAAKLKDPVNLSIGQPDFDVPEAVREAAVSAIRAGKNSYTQTQGGPELRRALLEQLGGRYADGELLVTSAVTGGLLLAFMALLDPGDEVLVPEPYFLMYKQLPLLLGARPVYYNTYPDWRIDAAELERLVTPRTKAICLNSPSNPTGKVYSRAELEEVARVAARHGLPVISDEIYSAFVYDGEFVSFREVYPDTLALGGFSKSHAMTGWRLGYAAGPAELIAAMTKFQQFTYVCAPAPFQLAGVAALNADVSAHIAEYRVKRDLIYRGLIEAGYEVELPGGAFYIFPKVPWGTDAEFVAKCIENGLLVIPGSVFSERRTHFRIAYAAKNETIARGVEILRRLRQG